MALLEALNLQVEFPGPAGRLRAVDGVDLSIESGEVIGLVGESGCGKSATALALMGLITPPASARADVLRFGGRDLGSLRGRARRDITGREMAMVFQEPVASLNPCYMVGRQVEEALQAHRGGNRRARRQRVVELFRAVGIPDPERRLRAYPHQLSGGMNQRVAIAMAIACNPRLLIADEPTTALDVTIQAQILDLLRDLQRQRDMALLLITHDLAVVAQTARRVLVMYAGQVVESGPVERVLFRPRHPYTAGLLASLPGLGGSGRRLLAIPGTVPALDALPGGCRFHPRCPQARERCRGDAPALRGAGEGAVRCYFPAGEGAA